MAFQFLNAEQQAADKQTLGIFLSASLWSAFCAIGYSIIYWLTHFRK